MRVPVELARSYRLLNHGPVVLVSAASGGRDNVMPAAWVMPIDFAPPLVAAVLAEDAFTRELVDAAGECALSIPPASMLDRLYAAGQVSGRDADKWAATGLARLPASRVSAPLVDGCLGWLECRVVERSLERLDLLVLETVAAWADDSVWRDGAWRFGDDPDRRTVHHLSGGMFFVTGEARSAQGAKKR